MSGRLFYMYKIIFYSEEELKSMKMKEVNFVEHVNVV